MDSDPFSQLNKISFAERLDYIHAIDYTEVVAIKYLTNLPIVAVLVNEYLRISSRKINFAASYKNCQFWHKM